MATVLLVEDNELNQDMLSRRLSRKGYEVTIAADGEQAIRAVSERLPDLILMDISLTGRDGHDITRELKAGAHTCAIPVIALTANAMASDREAAIAAGCDDFDTKPVDLTRLLSKMEAVLNCADSAS